MSTIEPVSLSEWIQCNWTPNSIEVLPQVYNNDRNNGIYHINVSYENYTPKTQKPYHNNDPHFPPTNTLPCQGTHTKNPKALPQVHNEDFTPKSLPH